MKKELEKPSDYFPYIGHRIDHDRQYQERIYKLIIHDLFMLNREELPGEDIFKMVGSGTGLFHTVKVKGLRHQKKLIGNNNAVQVLTPRHKTLYDYTVGQPVHHELVNPEVMLLAGNNLYVPIYGDVLRCFGAIMFLRKDVNLKVKGNPRAFLSQKRYINEVFPAYLRQQMVEGIPGDSGIIRRDLIIYPEQEKHPVTKKRNGGRTKTGKMRGMSHILFDKLKSITEGTDVDLYITPVNISFSKVPEVPYIVYAPVNHKIRKRIQYLLEQYFVYSSYPRFSFSHFNARLDVVVQYGKPELLRPSDITSTKDLVRFSKRLQEKIGKLETLFPLKLIFRAMDHESELTLTELENRVQGLFEKYSESGIDVSPVSDGRGNLLPVNELVENSVKLINCNPNMYLPKVKKNHFLTCKGGRIYSHDEKVQEWYSNILRHL